METLGTGYFCKLRSDSDDENADSKIWVQFNPESLSLVYSNYHTASTGGKDSALQRTGQASTRLTIELWFDVTAPFENMEAADDVRTLTLRLISLLNPDASPAGQSAGAQAPTAPPRITFKWGTFRFNGILDGVTERLEFFSDQGVPLRAMLSLSLTEQALELRNPEGQGLGNAGTSPLTPAPQGSHFQGLAASAGLGANWKASAALNGIENPRQLTAGAMLNLGGSGSAGFAARVDGGMAGSGSLAVQGGLAANLGFGPQGGAKASFSAKNEWVFP